MKAVYQTSYGKSHVLQYGEQTSPDIKPNEVLVRNYASSVNPRDWLIRSGRYQLQFLVPKFPLILGSDLAGEVIEVGERVRNFKAGDRVFGMKNPSEGLGAYAEHVSVPEDNISLIPDGLSYVEAAGLPLCALTAWQALVDKGHITKGNKVLVIGGSGGVGSYAVQIAKALGAEVSAVCSVGNAQMVERLGASKIIDYKSTDFTKAADRYDVIFDTIGRHSLARCERILNSKGRYITTIPSPSNLLAMLMSNIQSPFSVNARKANVVMVKSCGEDLRQISHLVERAQVRPVIDQVFRIQDAAKAHDYSRSLRAKGKIILDIQNI